MKIYIISLSITCFLFFYIESNFCQDENAEFYNEVADFQETINKQYGDSVNSPLTKKDLLEFNGLDFFSADPKFSVQAKFIILKNQDSFEMKTTTKRRPSYKIFGKVIFRINGKKYTLNIYQNQKLIRSKIHADHLFLPFTDLTNGEESYGGGRYIDLTIPKSKTLVIDFNKAYNPYCCYNSKYSCPIPPKENHLNFKVTAGVKAFEKEGH